MYVYIQCLVLDYCVVFVSWVNACLFLEQVHIYVISITSKSPKTLYSLCQRFVYHCIMPLCCLLALVANTTATTKFTYHLPQSKIYITSIGLYTLMPVSLARCLLWGHTHMRIKTKNYLFTMTCLNVCSVHVWIIYETWFRYWSISVELWHRLNLFLFFKLIYFPVALAMA